MALGGDISPGGPLGFWRYLLFTRRPLGPAREVGLPLVQYLGRSAGYDLGHTPRIALEHGEGVDPEGLHQGFGGLLTNASVGVRQIADNRRLARGQAEPADIDPAHARSAWRSPNCLTHDLTLKQDRAITFFATSGTSTGTEASCRVTSCL